MDLEHRATGRVLLCDGDLGDSGARLAQLIEVVQKGECDLAVAAFSRRVGGGFDLADGDPARHAALRQGTGWRSG